MRTKVIIIIVALHLLSIGYFFGESSINELLARSQNIYKKIKILTSIIETINRAYVDERDVDDLIDDAIEGVLRNLDPHTTYLSADDYKEWGLGVGKYSGVGVDFEILQDSITIMGILEMSSAAEIGLQPGDKIIAIDGESSVDLREDEVVKKLKEPLGKAVRIRVMRKAWAHPKEFKLMRKRAVLNAVPYELMLRNSVGLIKIERFNFQTLSQLEGALKHLESQGLKYLVLDLRGNAGGYLQVAVDVTNKFISGGNKIVTTKGRSGVVQEYYATEKPTYKMVPLAVLIDHGSASAAEIVAGAIQDLDRGLIIGESSFGKGLVQSQFRFHDGSVLLVTTARFYTPSGRSIQRSFENKSKVEYYLAPYIDGDPKNPDQQIANSPFRTLSGRPVNAGTGIQPDIVIENDEQVLPELVSNLLYSEKDFFNKFAKKFLKIKPKIKTNIAYFINNFVVTETHYREFKNFVLKEDPDLSDQDFESNKEDIKFAIKRELAYAFWGSKARLRVSLLRDQQLKEAVRQFRQL